jgi:hypothetical protein
MTANILTYHDVWMGAQADFEKWRTRFEQQFGEPIALLQMAMYMASMPPGVHAELQRRRPEEHKRVMQMIGGK